MGVQVDPRQDEIRVDGRIVEVDPNRTYVALYKPRGYLSVMYDQRGRRTLSDLVPGATRLHPAGRLDLDSEGLVLLTDDGALTQRLTHPRYEHNKEYWVLVRGTPGQQVLERLRTGVRLEDGLTAPAEVAVQPRGPAPTPTGMSWLRFVLHEGRKRQIRRMCSLAGHPVQRLIRVRIGPLELGDLEAGAYRSLTKAEVRSLLEETDLASSRPPLDRAPDK
jgi:23S rRNA pseudouridine2605 synthase